LGPGKVLGIKLGWIIDEVYCRVVAVQDFSVFFCSVVIKYNSMNPAVLKSKSARRTYDEKKDSYGEGGQFIAARKLS
jgi:hypothetical protein